MSAIEGLNRVNTVIRAGLGNERIGPGVTPEISKGINLQEFKILVQPVQHLPSHGRLIRFKIASGVEVGDLSIINDSVKPEKYNPRKRAKNWVDVSRHIKDVRLRRSGCRCSDKENGPACRSRFCEKKKRAGELNNSRAMDAVLKKSLLQNQNRRNEVKTFVAKLRGFNTPKLSKV